MSATPTLSMLIASAVLVGCAPRSEEFSLPAGDVERGREAFVAFRCYDCHDVHGVELPPREKTDAKIFTLGGEVARDKSYGDLVTGVINPSHRLAAGYVPAADSEDGKSPMKVYNDVMTVSQLVDIVTFLEQHYELKPYEPTDYPTYYP